MRLIDDVYFYPERGFLDCNTYIVGDAIIDPGSPAYLSDKIKEIEQDKIDAHSIKYVINTHLHPDHSGGNEDFAEEFDAKVAVYEGVKQYYSHYDIVLDKSITLNDIMIDILHTPGHSPESISLYIPGLKILLCGDLVFKQGVGRVDLIGGNAEKLKESINNVSTLDIEHLLPGHGPIIKGSDNVKKNFSYIIRSYFWIL
ncbi:MAG TPA: MBL fold metallo-hydrolase [Halobacteria archaeon]|nr:MBL fold metallo-hydrolase [Halobacteria archaeon]